MSDWVVYILHCSDDTLYTGVTTDPERRLHEHNNTKAGAAYTRARRPVRLAARFSCVDRSRALKAEYAIKQLNRSDKLALIEGDDGMLERVLNPD